jgi:hypothetical protein
MSGHNPGAIPPNDFAGQVIRIEAENLAQRFGLDINRVHRILCRTATDYYGRPIDAPAPGRDNLSNGLRFHPSLEEALAYLAPETALSLFEETDAVALSHRTYLIDYLADPATPSYTKADLARLLEAFGSHLNRNRDSLIRTGYPETRFDQSIWLEWHLSLLSPTKVPLRSTPFATGDGPPSGDHHSAHLQTHGPTPEHDVIASISDHGPLYSYSWSREAVPPLYSKEGPFIARSFEQQVPLEPCPYEESALMHGLSQDVARHLVDSRPKLLRVKQDTVSECARHLRAGDPFGLWPSVLEILTDVMMWQDVQQFLEVEETYWRSGI